MKKNFILGIFFICIANFTQSSHLQPPTPCRALYLYSFREQSYKLHTKSEHALHLPLQFQKKRPDQSIAFITFIGFQFPNGKFVYYPLPENPLTKKLVVLPKHPDQPLETMETLQIELNGVHFNEIE